jgi:hypothetical protein
MKLFAGWPSPYAPSAQLISHDLRSFRDTLLHPTNLLIARFTADRAPPELIECADVMGAFDARVRTEKNVSLMTETKQTRWSTAVTSC